MWPTSRTSTRDRWRSRFRDALAGLVVCALVAVLGPGTAVAKPRLKVVAQAPLTVRGTGFVAREAVRVRLLMPRSEMVRRVRASRRGRFLARFAGAAPDRCAGYSIVASGGAGSFVTLRWPARPGCPPALPRGASSRRSNGALSTLKFVGRQPRTYTMPCA